MFRRQLRHPQGALQQHLKLTKVHYITIAIRIVFQYCRI